MSILNYKFERVEIFKYVVLGVNESNDINEEINQQIQSANGAYFGLIKYFTSKLITCQTKDRKHL